VEDMDEYFEITRRIHQIMGAYTYNTLNKIEGIETTKPQATYYLLADFNHFESDFNKSGITTSQKLAETLIQHPYHIAIVAGDGLVLERTDFSARLAYVDYDGSKAYECYQMDPPKSSSEKEEFVQINAPRLIAGLEKLELFFQDIIRNTDSKSQIKLDSVIVSR